MLEAVRVYERALAEDPYKESELYYQIEDEIQGIRGQLHEQVRPLVTEALSLIEQGRLPEARQRLADAVARDPYYAPATSRLKQVEGELARKAAKLLSSAQASESAGELEDAVQLYRQVLSSIPDPSNPLHQKAALRLEQLKRGP